HFLHLMCTIRPDSRQRSRSEDVALYCTVHVPRRCPSAREPSRVLRYEHQFFSPAYAGLNVTFTVSVSVGPLVVAELVENAIEHCEFCCVPPWANVWPGRQFARSERLC